MSDSNAVLAKLRPLPDPEIGRSLGELGMLKGATLEEGRVLVEIDLPTPAYPNRDRIGDAVKAALGDEFGSVDVTYSSNVRGKETGGKIGLKVKNVVAVGSGKGGVGKSSVATAIAFGLHHYGAKVGLMDADVYGPSIPHMLGIGEKKPTMIQRTGPNGEQINRIEPLETGGVKCISMGFFVEPEKAVIWRGPLLHRAITQFLQETEWGELDYLIIDMPPGTGDVSLTLSQLLGLAGAVIVCTPQQVALLDAVKAISMFQQVNIPVLGIVENMAGDIFGRGGAKAKAEEMNVPFLGEVPIEADIRVKGDAGEMPVLFAEGSPTREPLLRVTENVAMSVARSLLENPSLPTLEVL